LTRQNGKYSAVAVGVSAGGLGALSKLLGQLPSDFSLPIIVVQHRSKQEKALLEELLQSKCKIRVKQADEKEKIEGGTVYLAPPDYHLLIERDHSFSLSTEPPVMFSRPSVDVLFETAAEVFGPGLIAIVLTGANHDGAAGISQVRQHGGTTIAQDPRTAEFPRMPQAAIQTNCVDRILNLDEIADFLLRAGRYNQG
jgi:two-component system chemotaxis response regulator CheB